MSRYVDYNVLNLSQNSKFDEIRKPVGAKHIIRALHTELRKPIGDVVVLDAGCGTGSYTVELLKAGVKRIILLDANAEMLKIANEKIGRCYNSLYDLVIPADVPVCRYTQTELPTIPFDDATFDCVMLNMVIHHLDFYDYEKLLAEEKRAESRPKQVEALKQAWRVLKHGGLVAMTVSFPHQILKGGWYSGLAPVAQKRASIRNADYDELKSDLQQAGFKEMETIVPVDTTFLVPEHYFDAEGPLKKEWRERDFILFSCPDSVDLGGILAMKEKGTLHEYMLEMDKGRKEVGQFSVVLARK